MRIVSWNIDGIARWLDDDSALATHVDGQLGAPDVLCLQEVRLRPADRDAIARMSRLLPGYTCAQSLCNDPRNVTFRGGRAYGVATFVHERVGHSLSSSPAWDREGRVVVTAVPAAQLAIVNLYAVNGTSKAYVDPASGEPRGDRHEYKRRFQDAVLDLANELRTVSDVVLCGDWNVSQAAIDVTPRLRTEEPHATSRARLVERLAADDWVDVLREREPAARHYTWFGRTRAGALDAARVDYFLVSRSLSPRVTSAGVLAERAQRPRSDHAPITLALVR